MPLAVTLIIFDPAKFTLGQLGMTPEAYDAIPYEEMLEGINRHLRADWGDLDNDDKAANDRALTNGLRLLSAYTTKSGIKFWIITEADRASTTVLLPEDY